jgi:hypothetical protein
MANRRHVDSSRIPVRTKRRTSKVSSSPATDSNDGAGENADFSPKAVVDSDFDSAREAAADVQYNDAPEDVDFDESGDTIPAAELLAAGGEIDDELSEELGVDNIVGPLEAGLGSGLDQAEEARAGITDEEIARKTTRR